MDHNDVGPVLSMLFLLGGVPLIIWVSVQAKIALIREKAKARRQDTAPQDGAVLAELKALRQQVAEMRSTGHEFDIAFDDALSQLKGRVDRVETRAAAVAAPPAETTLRNGNSSAP